jgi:hypothetical protein
MHSTGIDVALEEQRAMTNSWILKIWLKSDEDLSSSLHVLVSLISSYTMTRTE